MGPLGWLSIPLCCMLDEKEKKLFSLTIGLLTLFEAFVSRWAESGQGYWALLSWITLLHERKTMVNYDETKA